LGFWPPRYPFPAYSQLNLHMQITKM
jgi:hypothetical protein